MEALCRPLLVEHEGKDHASVVDHAAPQCQCEACALSPFDVVQPNEYLLRLVISPLDLHKKRPEVIASALSAAETRGLSSFRESYVSDLQLLETAQKRVEHVRTNFPKAGVFGVLRMLAADVKGNHPAEPGQLPPYCVYDVPDEGVDAHADILQRVAGAEEGLPALRRHWLFSRVGPTFIGVADFRGGLLLSLAPPL